MDNLPKSRVECVVEHTDGSKRICRLNHTREYWEIASFQTRKVEVVWSVDKTVGFKVISWDID